MIGLAVFMSNAPTRTRTLNLLIKSQLLCQLSYGGKVLFSKALRRFGFSHS